MPANGASSDAKIRRMSVRLFTFRVLVLASAVPILGAPIRAFGAPPAAPASWFTDITKASGLAWTIPPKAYTAFELPDIMDSGVALHDFDGDGDLDLYFTICAWDFGKPRKAPTNRYYRREPNGTYVDATVASGLAHAEYGAGCAVGDLDNDGDLDLFQSNYGPDKLYLNRGNGTFVDASKGLRIRNDRWSCSAACVDFDADGFLDITFNQYVAFDSTKVCKDSAGRVTFCGPKEYPPLSQILLRNNGDATFTDVTESAGLTKAKGAGLGVVCEDLNSDGRQDIYVANDAYANNLWINQGKGKFADEAMIQGCALNALGMAEAGMGVLAADLDNDIDLDLFITHLKNESNTIFENVGGGLGFEDATAKTGIGAHSIPYTGFGTVAVDFELDGDLDLFVGNGPVRHSEPMPGCVLPPPWCSYAEPSFVYLYEGKKYRVLGPKESGPITANVEVTRGTAAGDVDGDGDVDLVLSNIMSGPRLYRNDAPRKGRWLAVRAREPKHKRDAIGATVTLHAGSVKLLRTITAGGSYLSSSEAIAHFGLGNAARVDSLVVRWSDGSREVFPGGAPDRRVELVRGGGAPRT